MNAAPGRRPKILFVDDEQRILTTMRMLFRNDYDIHLANGGDEALAMLRNHDVDVIVSDQRMPGMTGIELLRQARDLRPNAMRILLTGYSDLNAIIGSINEGEIFRFVSKPWSNEELKSTVAKAVAAAQVDIAAATQAAVDGAAAVAGRGVGVLILDPDANSRAALQKMLGSDYPVYTAGTAAECLDVLEQQPVGVIVAEAFLNGQPVTSLLASLKQHQPHLVSVVMTERADANHAIDLINHGQIYRFLLKPLREGMCKINVVSALRHHAVLSRNPDVTRRYSVEKAEPPAEQGGLFARIRQLRAFVRQGS